ncbi:hypothetical protein [Celeribacter sp.]|uniref:hypothetical protein n=1 Tax=Celeribacter sp. TaxID=1890673 RepID=UPI003A90F48B
MREGSITRDVGAGLTANDAESVFVCDDDFVTPERCEALWLHVLREGVNSLLGRSWRLDAAGRAEAEAWFASSEFDVVCQFAAVDPERARAAVKELREQGVKRLSEVR